MCMSLQTYTSSPKAPLRAETTAAADRRRWRVSVCQLMSSVHELTLV